jgi:four helix bundle protein
MHPKTWELQARTERFAAAAIELCERLPADASAQRIAKKLTASATAMATGYTDVCASRTPERFIDGMSAVARQAKQAKQNLQLLLQLNHVTIESCRELLFEARGLENIFVASRNTAKRRRARAATARPA